MISLQKDILQWIRPLIKIPAIGIDISDLSVKYLMFRGGRSLQIAAHGEIIIPEGIVVNGEIKDEQTLANVLDSWRTKEGKHIGTPFIVAALPEEKSFLRVVQVPRITREEIKNAIRWEIETNIPLPIEELIYDYEIVEPRGISTDHLDVVITAFPKTTVESYIRVFTKAHLKPIALELESQAIARTLITNPQSHTIRIVADIGRARTGFGIIAGSAIVFTSTIPFGGKILEEHIARTLNVRPAEAVTIKKEIGLDKRAYEGRLFEELLPVVSVCGDELLRTIEYYRTHASHMHTNNDQTLISEILLVGGDSHLPGLDTYLVGRLKIPVRLADPLACLDGRLYPSLPPLTRNQARAFAPAIGLALRDI